MTLTKLTNFNIMQKIIRITGNDPEQLTELNGLLELGWEVVSSTERVFSNTHLIEYLIYKK